MPSKARLSDCWSAKSAITAVTPCGTLAVSSFERYIACTPLPFFSTSRRTAPPALPDAPVIRIMDCLLSRHARRLQDRKSSDSLAPLGRDYDGWYNGI